MAGGRFDPDVSEWNAWRPAEAARRLAGVDTPWYVIAGWSLDLFRGRQTREHDDLEIGTPRHGFAAIREALPELDFFAIVDGQAAPIDDESLEVSHQTWARDPIADAWRLDVVREPWEGDTWISRRDPSLRRPGSETIAHTAEGIPYQVPEIALLFKAKHRREKDQADFEGVLPLLDPAARGWLTNALALVHPGHPWIDAVKQA